MNTISINTNNNKISFGKVGIYGGQFGRIHKTHKVNLRRKQQEFKSDKRFWKSFQKKLTNDWKFFKDKIIGSTKLYIN